MKKSGTVNISAGLSALLGIVFIILKLCNIISWSWIWVLAPFWISFAFGIICIIAGLIVLHIKGQ